MVKKILKIVGIVMALFVALVCVGAWLESRKSPEQRAREAAELTAKEAEYAAKRDADLKTKLEARKAAEKPTLAERGETYEAADDVIGPVALSDREAIIKAWQYDKRGVLELVMQGKAKAISKGEKLLVTDRDVSISGGTWVEVRVVEGRAAGKLWIPQSILRGFEHTK